jgi:IS30 family transposase
MPLSRELSEDIKKKIINLHEAGIHTAEIRNILQHDQPEMTFLYDDIYNYIYNNASGSAKKQSF